MFSGIEGKCQHCEKTFYGSIKIKAHQGIFSRYKCPRCLIQICDHKKLYNHIKSHVGFKYQCFKCLKQFDTFEAHRNHRKSAHLNNKITTNLKKVWGCVLCQKKFSTFMAACKHRTKFCKHRNDQGCCNICNKMFSDKNKLMSHIRLHNLSSEKPAEHAKPKGDQRRKLICYKLIKKKYLKLALTKKNHCRKCVAGFKHRDAFYEHINQQKCAYLKNSLTCTLCRKPFDSIETLVNHVRLCFRETLVSLVKPGRKKASVTSESEKEEPLKMVYHCSKCREKGVGRMFPSKTIFKQHNALYHNRNKTQKAHQCNKCFFQCHSESMLRKHLKEKRCPKIDGYQCYLCNPNEKDQITFKSIHLFLKHLRTHKNSKKKKRTVIKDSSKVIPTEIDVNGLKKQLTFTCLDAKGLVGNYQIVNQGKKSYIVTVVREGNDYRVVAVPHNEQEQKTFATKSNKLTISFPTMSQMDANKPLTPVEVKSPILSPKTKIKVWHCAICNSIHKNNSKLKLHLFTRNHGNKEELEHGITRQFSSWKCCFCFKLCQKPFEHAETHTEIMFECYLCYTRVSSVGSMKTHFISKHQGMSNEDLFFYQKLHEDAVWKTAQTMYQNRKPKSRLSNSNGNSLFLFISKAGFKKCLFPII